VRDQLYRSKNTHRRTGEGEGERALNRMISRHQMNSRTRNRWSWLRVETEQLAGHAGNLGPIGVVECCLSLSVATVTASTVSAISAIMSLVWVHFYNKFLILNCVQIHALVAQGSTILAEHQAGKRDFSQGLFHKYAVTISRSTSHPPP
jgi:hypothetical protein